MRSSRARASRWLFVAGLVAALAAAWPLAAQERAAADLIAADLIAKVQALLRSDTNIGVYRMEIVRPEWRREIRLKSWDDRPGKRFFVHILAPKKDKDTTFLKVGGNLWMYLPKLERDIKIPPSMMLTSWTNGPWSWS